MTIQKALSSSTFTACLLVMLGSVEPVCAQEGGAATHLFVERAEAEKHETSPDTVSRVMLTADQTNGRYSIIDEIFKPGMKGSPHKHTYDSETFMVLQGKMKWTVAGETQTIGAGDLVYIPPDTVHQTEVVGDEAVHAIMLYEPGGYELGLRRRVNTPPEKMRNPEFRRELMELSDVVPVSDGGGDF